MIKGTIYFRADGDSERGLGHLVRCIALAQMLDRCFSITFCCIHIPASLQEDIKNHGFQLQLIQTESGFLSLLSEKDIVVLDGYHFTTAFQQQIKQTGCKLACIDDLHELPFVADLIINYAPGVQPADYIAAKETIFALGLEYVLLRKPFLLTALNNRQVKKSESVLICFGGSDVYNLTGRAFSVVKRFAQFKKIVLITGAVYSFISELEQSIKADSRAQHFHAIDGNDMCTQMTQTDLAIIPSSSIMLEAMAAGMMIAGSMYVDNQKIFYETLKQQNVFIDAADFSEEAIHTAVEKALSENAPVAPRLIDGKSPARLLHCFLHLHCRLRPAAAADALLFFNWANDSDVRMNAINQDAIIWESHVEWFEKKLASANTKVFVLEYLGHPAGQIRLDRDDDNNWLIDYSIDKTCRGFGLGRSIVMMAIKEMQGHALKAIVKESNPVSSNVFRSLHFSHSKVKLENQLQADCFLSAANGSN